MFPRKRFYSPKMSILSLFLPLPSPTHERSGSRILPIDKTSDFSNFYVSLFQRQKDGELEKSLHPLVHFSNA